MPHVCARCDEPIKSRGISAINKAWHEDCFTCNVCGKKMGEVQYIVENGFPNHIECLERVCAGCEKKIPPTEGMVHAIDRYYHPDCFICKHCDKVIEDEIFDYIGVIAYHQTCKDIVLRLRAQKAEEVAVVSATHIDPEEVRRKKEEEAARKKAEEEEAARKKAEEEEEARRKAEEEEAARKAAEEEAKRKAEEEAKRKAEEEEARRKAEEEEAARKAAEEEAARKKAEEEEAARKAAEEEAKRKAEEEEAARKAAEEEARRKAEEEAEAKRKAEEEARKAAEEEEARRKAEEAEAARKAAEEEAKRKAEEEEAARLKALEEERRKAEEAAEAARKAREEERKRADEEDRKRKEEAERRRKKGPQCCSCKKEIYPLKEGTSVDGRPWHKSCFVCSTCGVPIDGDFIEVEGQDGKVFHEECLEKVENNRECPGCKKDINPYSKVSIIDGRAWHPACFKCSFCGEVIKTSSYVETHDKRVIHEGCLETLKANKAEVAQTKRGLDEKIHTVDNKTVIDNIDITDLLQQKTLQHLFDTLDVDSNGCITPDEMSGIYNHFNAFGMEDTETTIKKAVTQWGLMDDGKISFEEFAILMMKLVQS